MTITRVGGSGKVAVVNASSITVNYTPSPGNHITVVAALSGPSTTIVTQVADSSSTNLTIKQFGTNPSGGEYMESVVAYRESVPAGLTSFTLTFSGLTYGSVSVEEWSGVASSLSFDTMVSSSTATNTAFTTNAVAPADPNSLVVYVGNSDDNINNAWTNPPTGGTPTFTQLWQEPDSTNTHPGQAFYHVRSNSSASQQAVITYPNAVPGYVALAVIFKPASGGAAAVPFVPLAQLLAGTPWSVAPYLRGSTAALQAPANTGVYIPVGRAEQRQAQMAYREASRNTAQPNPPVINQGIATIYLGPQRSQYVPVQPVPFVRIPQLVAAVIPVPAANVLPTSVVTPATQPWPYAMFAALEIVAGSQPSQSGITAIYLGPNPPQLPQPAPWPYAVMADYALELGAAVNQPAASYLGPTNVAVPPSPLWPYLTAVQKAITSSGIDFGIGTYDLIFDRLKPDIVEQQPWPYQLVAGLAQQTGAPLIPVAAMYLGPNTPQLPLPMPWPYTLVAAGAIAAGGEPSQFGITAIYLGPQPSQYVAPQPWPYTLVDLLPGVAATTQPPPPYIPLPGPVNSEPPPQPWPYTVLAQNLIAASTRSSQFGIATMFVFPAGPVNSNPPPQPWPYARTAVMPTFYLDIPAPPPGVTVIEWLMQYRRRGRR